MVSTSVRYLAFHQVNSRRAVFGFVTGLGKACLCLCEQCSYLDGRLRLCRTHSGSLLIRADLCPRPRLRDPFSLWVATMVLGRHMTLMACHASAKTVVLAHPPDSKLLRSIVVKSTSITFATFLTSFSASPFVLFSFFRIAKMKSDRICN